MRGSFYAESTRPQRLELTQSFQYSSLFFIIIQSLFFDGHIAELGRIEDFATGLALDIFGVLVSGDDLNDGVFALGGHKVGDLVGMVWILPGRVRLVNSKIGLSIQMNCIVQR